jgi:hypothetical protein
MSLRSELQNGCRCLYRRVFLRLLLVSWVGMFCILFYQSFMITSKYSDTIKFADLGRPEHVVVSNSTGQGYEFPANRAFGACLMSKDDNQLLFEWLAYHYTVLPLRYVVIGSDIGNRQDPRDVLHRWNFGGFHYVVLNVTDEFDEPTKNQSTVDNSGHNNSSQAPAVLDAHHGLIRRQKRFITTCIQELKKRWNVHWATFVDSDEFVTWNPATSTCTSKDENDSPTSLDPTLVDIRRNLPLSQNGTILDVLTMLQATGHVDACYTIPRLRFGALENVTCPEASSVVDLARAYYSSTYSTMSFFTTLRFVQHAAKGDFSKSKFGKVIMDLSKLSDDYISNTTPRNIHRPYIQYCGPAGKSIHSSFLRLNHYLGSWDRYASRDDQRRDRSYWESVASLNDENACNSDYIHTWLPRFIQMVGEDRAKFLLGFSDKRP